MIAGREAVDSIDQEDGDDHWPVTCHEPRSGPMLDADAARQIRALLEKGLLGAGVLETDDCRATYDELRQRGVEFIAPPSERFYGIEAIFKDGVGNWFSLTERHSPVRVRR
jgi:hypothetical protein